MAAFLLYSSSSDGEDSIQEITLSKRRLGCNINVMNIPPNEFKQNFRMNKETFLYVLNEISPHLKQTTRSSSVPKLIKLATTLRFLATGGYQKGVGNEFMSSLSQSKVCEVIEECFSAMEQSICKNWIRFNLTPEEEIETKSQFLQKFRIPGVFGCVDGTHVKIMAPKEEVRHLYYNRKGYYSLNVMMICDSNLTIKFVDARHAGANHDAFVWSSSIVDEYLKNAYLNGKRNTWVLGDSGYQCLPYLLTPYRSPSTESQANYNTHFIKARNTVERCFGVLKNRFRCLIGERGMHYSPDKAKSIVNACCALHNICIYYKNDWAEMESTEELSNNENIIHEFDSNLSAAGRNIRDQVANNL